MSEETETQEEVGVPTPAEINLNDLAVVLQVIDVCSKRGAFEGNELKDVGTLRERISNYVSARVPAQEESSEDTDTEGDS